ncbi:MAG: methyl-accepting chemotaxis protein, partial [Faecalibacterium sp.]|nr:methyl-accepting chemotaxis protein [Faecalibacterium sp.]
MKHFSKKALSVLMALMMLMTVFSVGLTAFAAKSNIYTEKIIVGNYPSERASNGGAAYGMSPWDGSNTHFVYSDSLNSGADYVKITTPTHIYLDKTETLQSAGYYISLDWQWWTTDAHRIAIQGYAYGVVYADGFSAYSGSTGIRTMVDNFTNYDVNADVYSGGKRYGDSNASSTDFDVRTDDTWVVSNKDMARNVVFRSKNTNSREEKHNKIFMYGTPNGTFEANYTTSGANQEILRYERWESNQWKLYSNGSIIKKDDLNRNTSTSKSGEWVEIQWGVTVYDKSALNSQISEAESILSKNAAYKSLQVNGTYDELQTAVNNAKTILTRRETTQSEIDNAKDAVNTARVNLRFQASNAALATAYNNAVAMQSTSDWTNGYYTQESMDALTTAVNNARSAATTTPSIYAGTNDNINSTVAGAKANTDQTNINNLKAAIDAAKLRLAPPDFSAFTEYTLPYGTCYTEETLNAYNNAVQAVKDLQNDALLTKKTDQGSVDRAIAAVETAYGNLVVAHKGFTYTYDGDENTHTHTMTCTGCGAYANHLTCNDTTTETDPSCTQAGVVTHTCNLCGHSYTTEGRPVTAHTYPDTWSAKAGDKNNHYKKCINCDNEISEACTKVFTQYVATPDCTNGGMEEYECSACHQKTNKSVGALGHDFATEFTIDTPATCTTDGSKSRHCTREGCTATTEVTVIPATNHNWGAWEVVTPATCTEKGSEKRVCVNDATHVETRDIDMIAHSLTATAYKAATCSATGNEEYWTCSECGGIFSDSEGKNATTIEDLTIAINEDKHSFTTYTSNNDATCLANGTKKAVCDWCHTAEDVITDEGTQLGHSYTGAYVQNDAKTEHARLCVNGCNEPGKFTACSGGTATCQTQATCEVCEKLYGNLGAHKFDYENQVVIKDENNKEQHKIKCLYCDETELTAHNYSETSRLPASCTVDEQITYTCSDCQYQKVEKGESKSGHSFTVKVEVKTPATCTEMGVTTYKCVRCDATEDRTDIAALGHNYESTVTEPTCTEGGYTTHTCSRCDDSYTDSETEALGHECTVFVEVKTPATCTEMGVTTYKCIRCDATEDKTDIEALGHNYESTVTEPTCTEGGYTTHTCSRCDDSYTDSETEALGH